MLSRDCDGRPTLHSCSRHYGRAAKDDKVYCSDGTAHLIDAASVKGQGLLE